MSFFALEQRLFAAQLGTQWCSHKNEPLSSHTKLALQRRVRLSKFAYSHFPLLTSPIKPAASAEVDRNWWQPVHCISTLCFHRVWKEIFGYTGVNYIVIHYNRLGSKSIACLRKYLRTKTYWGGVGEYSGRHVQLSAWSVTGLQRKRCHVALLQL